MTIIKLLRVMDHPGKGDLRATGWRAEAPGTNHRIIAAAQHASNSTQPKRTILSDFAWQQTFLDGISTERQVLAVG